MKVFVVGSGSWGTALACTLLDNNQEVLIYGHNPKEIADINENHLNRKFFDDFPVHYDLRGTTDISLVNDYDLVLLAVPSKACISVLRQLKQYLTHKVIILNVAKGFHPDTHERLSTVVIREMGDKLESYAALLGPSHAEEVIRKMLTAVNIVSEDEETAIKIQHMFANEYFRVYRNTDVIGCEYASGLKNIIAIASGILYGLGLGDNAKASLMTRGLAEMTRYGLAKGGKMETFIGLCGMGDLIVTCTSRFSRNWQAGYQIGCDNSAANFWKTNEKTVEGVEACRIIKQEAEKIGISMPITNELYEVLFNDAKPSESVLKLMTRKLRQEN